MEGRSTTLFREIHKNTWLKRLSVDNKKVLIGPKKSDRSWVVFCVHDDCEAMLEGYIEPRQAAQHTPEWTVPLQHALHVSHSLIPSEHEYEFVVTLPAEVVRFNAASWEIMQEWVDTLRQKLREMKILSPKENLYSKLPEIRAPLLPTRDPTSPLPAPPPVPAALVPGIERLPTPSVPNTTTNTTIPPSSQASTVTPSTSNGTQSEASHQSSTTSSSIITNSQQSCSLSIAPTAPAMSNTLTQNLINMLSNPVSAYSHQLSNISSDASSVSLEDSFFCEDEDEHLVIAENAMAGPSGLVTTKESNLTDAAIKVKKDLFQGTNEGVSLAKTFSNNVLADPNTCPIGASSVSDSASERVRFETADSNDNEASSLESLETAVFQNNEPLIIPRPQTSRSSARDKTPAKRRPSKMLVAAETSTSTPSIVIPTDATTSATSVDTPADSSDTNGSTNITIIQVSSSPVNKQPMPVAQTSKIQLADDQYKSNVQIIPSNIAPESPPPSDLLAAQRSAKEHQVTTVQVSGEPAPSLPTPSTSSSGYGKIRKTHAMADGMSNISTIVSTSTTISKVVTSTTNTTTNVLATKFGAITNIPITSSSSPANNTSTVQLQYADTSSVPSSPKPIPKQRSGSNAELHVNRINLKNESIPSTSAAADSTKKQQPPQKAVLVNSNSQTPTRNTNNHNNTNLTQSTKTSSTRENIVSSPLPAIRKLLTRGMTEISIGRTARRDVAPAVPVHSSTSIVACGASPRGRSGAQQSANTGAGIVTRPTVSGALQNEAREQRKRSSSHSDAQGIRGNGAGRSGNNNGNSDHQRRDDKMFGRPTCPAAPSRLTMREQQVLELRKEMMHMGGVRFKLRRSDCIGSIALCDAFGAVWVCGWKQKDYPVLYNALHIGDQLVTVAGVNVSCMADVHKIIRNVSAAYIEFILRRLPFGRVYAIRRDMDGQCLGLIRDGNTATIVDVVPKSLSARHGLPPKAQSCDGLSLTFWVLTEINGRPLNLFFKENEVRDRLSAVGRDISILVQPADLIAKLKKQLKSMRSYKDYIVQ